MEEFKPIPGYEGLYSITELGRIRHDKFARLKTTTITKQGQEVIVLYKNGMPVMYTVKSLIDLTWNNIPIKPNEGSAKAHSKQIKCISTGQVFESYRQCCEYFGFNYRNFIAELKKSNIYKGKQFEKID